MEKIALSRPPLKSRQLEHTGTGVAVPNSNVFQVHVRVSDRHSRNQ